MEDLTYSINSPSADNRQTNPPEQVPPLTVTAKNIAEAFLEPQTTAEAGPKNRQKLKGKEAEETPPLTSKDQVMMLKTNKVESCNNNNLPQPLYAYATQL
ncbi:unnamed protein product [Caretta caretta]